MTDSSRILIVEDSPTQALRLQLDLADKGWTVECVGNAQDALQLLDKQTPDLMIVDYNLPGISGDEFCRRVRMNINTRGIPIIMLTADEDQSVEVRGLDSGADDFFKKSADTEILVLRIRAMLERTTRGQSVLHQNDTLFQRARILAVDDSRTYLVHLKNLLTGEGYSVETVDRGRSALEKLEHETFDCVLIDLVMPDLDGIEVCRRIIAMRDRLDSPIAVLMLTGREGKEDLTRALEAGADDFVGKSSDEAVLKGRIRALLRRKFYQEENHRILEELKNKELEAACARAEKEAALARAAEERQWIAEKTARELRRAKVELEQANEELVHSNDELRQFAFMASHDLQEPLRSITSFCNLLQESYKGQLDQQADDFIERIVNGAKRMKALVQGLLSYSRLTRADHDSFREADGQKILEDVLEDLRLPIEESGAQVTWDPPPVLYGSATQLTQIFENLIANAIRYCDEDVPKIHIEFNSLPQHCEVAVHDNGIGIAEEHRECIFELFKRLKNRDDTSGTGIGLTICKKIAQRHGGTIWVESGSGKGSTFRFTIATPKEEEPGDDSADNLCAPVEYSAG
jgi:DNA-binding response OmpR family regulator